MGYTTDFRGRFTVSPALRQEDKEATGGCPSIWCQWVPSKDGDALVWDGGEKFYNYVEWIKYLIDRVLRPKGYRVDGDVEWLGEDHDDRGKIVVVDNAVKALKARVTYDEGR